MARLVRVHLVERIIVKRFGIFSTQEKVVTDLGERALPWTTTLELNVFFTGTAGETFTAKTNVLRSGGAGNIPLFSGSQVVTAGEAGERSVVLRVGPLEFTEPGTYEFHVYFPDDSLMVTATLARVRPTIKNMSIWLS